MTRRLTFHPQFKRDVATAARHYEDEQAGSFRDEVFAAIARVQDLPLAGGMIDAEIRHLLLRRFLYHLLYVADQEVIFILAVAHQHRRPGNWQRRLG